MTPRPRFIIADNALKTVLGHYYEYDVSVLANVPADAYDRLILSNIDTTPDLQGVTVPFFQCDFWAPSQAKRAAPAAASAPAELPPPAEAPAPAVVPPPPAPAVSAWRLRYRRGLEWAKRLDRRYGQTPLARPLFVLAKQVFYRARAWYWRRRAPLAAAAPAAAPSTAEPPAEPVRLNAADAVLREIFLQDLRDLFVAYQLRPEDVLFFPNMNQSTLAAVIDFVAEYGLERLPQLKLLFRRNVFSGRPTADQYRSDDYYVGVYRALFQRLDDRAGERLSFYTDTARLKTEYEVFCPQPFTVLPIPFRHDYIVPKAGPGRPLRLVYLGNARSEKGFQYLPALVEHLHTQSRRDQVEFVFQAVPDPEPVIHAALQQLRRRPEVRLLETPLSDREYYDLLNSADILLLLYDPVLYYSRSSCIFVESVISATPFVTLAGSWMAEVMAPGTGVVVENLAELGPAVEQLLDNYASYYAAVRQASQEWKTFHHPRHLVELLLPGAGRPDLN